jgi:UDP-glucose 4-epimerase
MKVLITGGVGFIGSTIAATLAKKNYSVVLYDIGTWDATVDNIQHVKGDVFDVVHLSYVLKQCDAVIHMIGLPDARTANEHPQMSFDLNVRSLQVLLEAQRNTGVLKLVLASSASIYGIVDRSPISEETVPKLSSIYAYHKYVAENLAEAYSIAYGVRATALRLFNVYGIRGAGILNILLEKAIKNEPVKLYGEKQKRDFIHVSDVADAFARVLNLENKFEVYNVGTGKGRSIEEIVNLVKGYYPNLLVEYGDYRGVLFDSAADITKIKKATGFNPSQSDDKLRQVIYEWRKQTSGNDA